MGLMQHLLMHLVFKMVHKCMVQSMLMLALKHIFRLYRIVLSSIMVSQPLLLVIDGLMKGICSCIIMILLTMRAQSLIVTPIVQLGTIFNSAFTLVHHP